MSVLPSFKSTFSSLADVECLGRQDHSAFCTQSNAPAAAFDPLNSSFRTHSSSATPSSYPKDSVHSATPSRSTSSRPDIPLLPLDQLSGEAPTFGFQSRLTPRRSPVAPLPIDVEGLGFCVTGNPYLSSTLRSLKRPSSPQSQIPTLKRCRPLLKPSPRPSALYPEPKSPRAQPTHDVLSDLLPTASVKVVEDSKGRAPVDVLSIPAQRSLPSSLSARPISGRTTSLTGAISIVRGPTRSDLSHLLAVTRNSPVATSGLVDGTDALNNTSLDTPCLELTPDNNNITTTTLPSSVLETTTTNRTRTPSLKNSESLDKTSSAEDPLCPVTLSTETVDADNPENVPRSGLKVDAELHHDSDKAANEADAAQFTKLSEGNDDAFARDGLGLVQCPICLKKLRNAVTLQNHIKVVHDHNGNFKCRHCDLTFMWRSTLGNHIRLVHEKQRPHACNECGKAFRWKSHLREHIWVVHKGEKPFKCEHCGKTFGRKNNMQKHMRKHNELNDSGGGR